MRAPRAAVIHQFVTGKHNFMPATAVTRPADPPMPPDIHPPDRLECARFGGRAGESRRIGANGHGGVTGDGNYARSWPCVLERNPSPVAPRELRLGKCKADRPWPDAPRDHTFRDMTTGHVRLRFRRDGLPLAASIGIAAVLTFTGFSSGSKSSTGPHCA